MTDTTAQTPSPLTGNVLFYVQPEPVAPETHGDLGVTPTENPYAFMAQSHLVPLTVTEFAPAALSYPVIFLGDNNQPVAVMGLGEGQNFFIDEAGALRGDCYVPAYSRRYPFVYANDQEQNRMILCIDRAAPFLVKGGEVPLFEGNEPSAYTKNAIEFCNNFEQERQRTDAFVALLTELDMFEKREAVFTPRDENGNAGEPQKLAEYLAVSEEKLRLLSVEKLAELRDNGALGQIYAHLTSLLGWDRLIALAFQRANQAGTQAGNA